jgi:hypothetical protein
VQSCPDMTETFCLEIFSLFFFLLPVNCWRIWRKLYILRHLWTSKSAIFYWLCKLLDLLFLQGVPHLRGFHYRGFWLMYAQAGDFRVIRGPPTVPLTQILRNAVFFKSQNPRKAGTLCTGFYSPFYNF